MEWTPGHGPGGAGCLGQCREGKWLPAQIRSITRGGVGLGTSRPQSSGGWDDLCQAAGGPEPDEAAALQRRRLKMRRAGIIKMQARGQEIGGLKAKQKCGFLKTPCAAYFQQVYIVLVMAA